MEKNKSVKFRKAFVLGGLSALLSGCSPDPTIEMKTETHLPLEAESNPNYSVTRVAVFKDNLAYGDLRGIYEIVDVKTGKKYLGVSGIGICEIGSHTVDKTSVEDER